MWRKLLLAYTDFYSFVFTSVASLLDSCYKKKKKESWQN